MLTVKFKQIYETNEKGNKEWILVIYDISPNHYVGIPVHKKEKEGCLYCESIDKYVDITKISDYNRSKMKRCIYMKSKPLKLSTKDYNAILLACKDGLIKFLKDNINSDVYGVGYIKWCRDKFIINSQDIKLDKLKQNAIYWVNLGIGVGSELRKLRPAILWRATGDKKLWTMIPLTTKKELTNIIFIMI